jgi:hypothetical protein
VYAAKPASSRGEYHRNKQQERRSEHEKEKKTEERTNE